MAIRLKQSTASQEIPLGYFVDSTDGNTEETALTIANTDIKLWKMGATTLANKNSGGATHISNGVYYCVLDATDTDTLGALVVFVHVSGALSVRVECEVLAANVYDSMIAASDKLTVHADEITNGLITAAAIATGAIDADAIADNAIDAGAIAADAITAAKIAADVSAEIADAVWDEAATGHTDAGKAGEQLWTDVDAILVDTGTTLDDLVDDLESRIGTPSNLGSGATIAANLVDIEAQTDDIGAAGAGLTALATQASVNTIDDFLDTEIQTIITMLTGIAPVNGTIGATGNDTTHLHLSGLAYADDGPNSMLILVKDVSAGIFVSRWIEDFANATDLATVATLPFTPEASVDLYWILPIRADVTGGSGLDAAGVRAAVGLASANLDTQLSTIDTVVDSVLEDTGTTLQGEVDGIQADTEDIQTRLPAALVSGRIDASVGAMAANVLTATAINADAITAAKLAADVTTELQNGLATASALATAQTGISAILTTTSALQFSIILTYGEIGSTGNDTTHVHIPNQTYGDDEINNHLVVILDVSTGELHARWIEDFVNSTGLATVVTLPFTPENATDQYYLLSIRRDVTASVGAADIRSAVGLASANLDTQLAAIWTTALTEAYRATGATGTPAQLLYEILAHLGEASISGTTKTLKKLDGSTTAKTYTLDSATTPTSITETT